MAEIEIPQDPRKSSDTDGESAPQNSKKLLPTNGEAAASDPKKLLATNGEAAAQDPKKPSDANRGETIFDPPAYLFDALIDAERLLKYTAETGINIDKDMRSFILQARAAGSKDWTRETADNLLAALTKLAAGVKPVTAGSLKWSDDNRPGSSRTLPTASPTGMWDFRSKFKGRRPYLIATLVLAFLIIPFSVLSFVSNAISDAIQNNIKAANDLAVKLRVQLVHVPPASTAIGSSAALTSASSPSQSSHSPDLDQDVLTELQEFASRIRDIYGLAGQLNDLFLHRLKSLNVVQDPYAKFRGHPDKMRETFELPVDLHDLSQAAQATNERLIVYQNVRYFGQTLVNFVSVIFAAFTACILPVLYALFGTCAFLLRSYEQKAYEPPEDWARFLIAGIGGAVIGLFNNFNLTQPSVPPLAIAFLLGYAVDVFFAFLENLLPKK